MIQKLPTTKYELAHNVVGRVTTVPYSGQHFVVVTRFQVIHGTQTHCKLGQLRVVCKATRIGVVAATLFKFPVARCPETAAPVEVRPCHCQRARQLCRH